MKLFFRKYGAGPSMIIVHGLYGASDNWVKIAKILGAHFEVFLLDQRNHGRSPHHPVHTYSAMSNDLAEFMDHENIPAAILLGHSMGGKTVMSFATEHTKRTNGMIVIDIAPKSYVEVQGQLSHRSIIEAMCQVDFEGIQKRTDVDKILAEEIPSVRVRQFLMKNLHRNKDQTFSWSLNLKALRNNLDHILGGPEGKMFEEGSQVTGFPALFIRGANSTYIQDEDKDLILRIFPFSDIITIPDAGHWLHVEQPNLLTKAIFSYFLD